MCDKSETKCCKCGTTNDVTFYNMDGVSGFDDRIQNLKENKDEPIFICDDCLEKTLGVKAFELGRCEWCKEYINPELIYTQDDMQFCSLKCIASYYGLNCFDDLDGEHDLYGQYLDEEDEYYASLDDSDEDTIFEDDGDEEEDIDL